MLVLRNAFNPALIETLRDEFFIKYQKYFENKDHPDALKTGNKRFMITAEVTGSFNNPDFYAHPKIIPLLEYLLGERMILSSVGSVISLPGAKLQHKHRDRVIYDSMDNRSFAKLAPLLPPFAITLIVPLVPLDDLNGTTRMWPETHLLASCFDFVTEFENKSVCEPHTQLGDCYLMDYRLLHQGLPNNATQVRPIMYNTYTCPWYQDDRNYSKQKRLVISGSALNNVPETNRKLMDWVSDPYY